MLPNFLGIGAHRCGTSSLHNYLGQHPDIFLARKEPRYFAFKDVFADSVTESTLLPPEGCTTANSLPFEPRRFSSLAPRSVTTMDAYQQLFKYVANEKAIGEISPIYLYHPYAHWHIRKTLPDARLIVSLRNPVDRAYSHAVRTAVTSGRWHHLPVPAGAMTPTTMAQEWSDDYFVFRGLYHDQLKPYYDVFPHENIKVYLFESFRSNPIGVMQDLYRFLGVNDTFVPEVSQILNRSGVPRNQRWFTVLNTTHRWLRRHQKILPKSVLAALRSRLHELLLKNLKPSPPLPAELRCLLTPVFRDDILKLQDLVQLDLSCWLQY